MSAPPKKPWAERRGRWLEVRLPTPCRGLSWALVGGGFSLCSRVVWWQVTSADLPPSLDPQALLSQTLKNKGWDETIAMMTSRRLDRFVHWTEKDGDLQVDVVATVGLSNGMAVGDPATYRLGESGSEVPGTINIHSHVSWPLSDTALVEGLALVAEARTAALLERPMESTLSSHPVTGTGTDCIAVTCPVGQAPQPYAGKHGVVGATLGRAVRRAVSRGREQWELDRVHNDLNIPLESD